MNCRTLGGAALFFWLIFAETGTCGEMVVQACFSPQKRCSAHIVRQIAKAEKEILVAIYAFTHHDLAAALLEARRRGVTVRVIIDREFDAVNANSKGRFLETQKVSVRRISGARLAQDKEAGLMHQKFAVIDGAVVFTGSYNWTHSADRYNDENLLMFRHAGPLAEAYRKVFFHLWERKP